MMKKINILFAVTTFLGAGLAHADADLPVCNGTSIHPSLRGTYENRYGDDVMKLELREKSVFVTSGSETQLVEAWTCESLGVLVLVSKFAEDAFESHILVQSGNYVYDAGEIYPGRSDAEAIELMMNEPSNFQLMKRVSQ